MITRNYRGLALGLAILAFAALMTSPSLAASYAMPSSQASAIQYVYFDPSAPPSPGTSGWEGSGKYSLPPDIGAVTVDTMAFGSLMTNASGNPSQAFVVRLTIANDGTQSMTIDPAAVRLVDKAGRVLVGARAFSGNSRISSDTIGPGGKDVLQLEFPLPAASDIKTLEIEDVDLPYTYGTLDYVTRLGFVPAENNATYYAPRQAPAATPSYAANPDYTNNYIYYDTSGYGYPDYTTSWWWQPNWGWWWWPSTVGFVGDSDFDRDDGFFGHHHGMHGLNDLTGTGLWKNDKTAGTAAATSKTFGTTTTTGIGGRKGAGTVLGGTEHHSATTLFAPRTTGGVFGSTGKSSVRPMTTTLHNNASTFVAPKGNTFIAPRTFSAPHITSFSAPHFSSGGSSPHITSFSVPHFSGGGGFRGGGGGRGR